MKWSKVTKANTPQIRSEIQEISAKELEIVSGGLKPEVTFSITIKF